MQERKHQKRNGSFFWDLRQKGVEHINTGMGSIYFQQLTQSDQKNSSFHHFLPYDSVPKYYPFAITTTACLIDKNTQRSNSECILPQPVTLKITKNLCKSDSVVSDSLQPHGATRLLCPWNSPGKNIGVGCHSLLQGIFLIQGSPD